MRARELPDQYREALLELARDTSSDGKAFFGAALREHHESGWSYRQLGTALGRSHESVRRLIAAAEGTVSPIAPPWESPAKPTVLEANALPDEIAKDLSARLLAALKPSLGDKKAPLSPAVAALYAGLAGAVDAGWDPYEIGIAIGMHPRAVARFAYAYAKQPLPVAKIPRYHHKAPVRGVAAWNARHPTHPPVTVAPEDREHLANLRDDASTSRTEGQAAREYTRILAAWYLLGASREELEQATGQQWDTLRRRLMRWGVMRDPRFA